MGQARYLNYLDEILALTMSMVVKCSAIADPINQSLMEVGENVDLADKNTWKYYMNLAGEYHPTDEVMTITSQDTLQTIEFTPQNLAVNIATKKAYTIGGRYYYDLLNRYPDQDLLIRGIMHPVDKQTAIDAEDGTILWHDVRLVDNNEMSLIRDLEQWIKHYLRRWNVAAYAVIDDLYLAGMLGILYNQIPAEILRIRLKYAKTYQAHRFHITEYLAGHNGLDAYVPYMTKEQALWLYRNIRYIERNPGKKETFHSLIENILTARHIPLSSWSMRHDNDELDNRLVGLPHFEKNTLTEDVINASKPTRSVHTMLVKEVNQAYDNKTTPVRVNEVTKALTHSLSDQLSTKVLESSVYDTADATAYRLSDCLLNHWIYFSSIGKYRSVVNVKNPETGDTYTLPVKEAFILYMYLFTKSRGLSLDYIPRVIASKVIKLNLPQPDEIRPYLTDHVDDDLLMAVYKLHEPLDPYFISISAFRDAVDQLHKEELYQHSLFSTQGHKWTRAEMEFATLYLWQDIECDFGKGTLYGAWLADKNIDIAVLSESQMDTMASTIAVEALGESLSNKNSLSSIQNAMMSIMEKLSSYTIQFLNDINKSQIRVLERPSIRAGDSVNLAQADDPIKLPEVKLMDEDGKGQVTAKGTIVETVSNTDMDAWATVTNEVDLTVYVEGKVPVKVVNDINSPRVGLVNFDSNVPDMVDPTNMDTDLDGYIITGYTNIIEGFPGVTFDFYNITDNVKDKLESEYNDYVEEHGEPATPLSSALDDQTIMPELMVEMGVSLNNNISQQTIYPELDYEVPYLLPLDEDITEVYLIPDIGLPEPIDEFVSKDLLPSLQLPSIIDNVTDGDLLPALIKPKANKAINDINKNLIPALAMQIQLDQVISNNELDGLTLGALVRNIDFRNLIPQLSLKEPPPSVTDINENLIPALVTADPITFVNINLLPGLMLGPVISNVNRVLTPALQLKTAISQLLEHGDELLPELYLTKPLKTHVTNKHLTPELLLNESIGELINGVNDGLVVSTSLTEVMDENQYIKTVKS